MYKDKGSAEDEKFTYIKQSDSNIFKMVQQIRKDSKDIIGGTSIKDKNENLCFTKVLKKTSMAGSL